MASSKSAQPSLKSNRFSYRDLSAVCSKIFLNQYFLLALFVGAAVIVALGKTTIDPVTPTSPEVIGTAVFVGIICLALVLCDDIFATTAPFLLLCVFVTSCYDSFDAFIKYAPLGVVAVMCIIFHFVYFKKRFVIGNTFWGLIAISAAITLGGAFFIEPSQYFSPTSLYYTAALGFGMVIFYLLFKSQINEKRGYDPREKFISVLYLMGALATFAVIVFVLKNLDFIKGKGQLPAFQPSNNLSTMLMFALPCPFYFARKNPVHLIVPFLMYGSMILTGSRGGILLGAVHLVICLVISACWDKPRRALYVATIILLIAFALIVVNNQFLFKFFFGSDEIDSVISENEARYQLLTRAKEIFPDCMIFGHGLAYNGNTDLYSPVKGAMQWYHMMIPQIVASLGFVGIAAYSAQFVLRLRSVFTALATERKKEHKSTAIIYTLLLSYLGVLLMSQVNPGLFCPIPYSLMAVMIFALID